MPARHYSPRNPDIPKRKEMRWQLCGGANNSECIYWEPHLLYGLTTSPLTTYCVVISTTGKMTHSHAAVPSNDKIYNWSRKRDGLFVKASKHQRQMWGNKVNWTICSFYSTECKTNCSIIGRVGKWNGSRKSVVLGTFTLWWLLFSPRWSVYNVLWEYECKLVSIEQ